MKWRRSRRDRPQSETTPEFSVEDAVVAALFPPGNIRFL